MSSSYHEVSVVFVVVASASSPAADHRHSHKRSNSAISRTLSRMIRGRGGIGCTDAPAKARIEDCLVTGGSDLHGEKSKQNYAIDFYFVLVLFYTYDIDNTNLNLSKVIGIEIATLVAAYIMGFHLLFIFYVSYFTLCSYNRRTYQTCFLYFSLLLCVVICRIYLTSCQSRCRRDIDLKVGEYGHLICRKTFHILY